MSRCLQRHLDRAFAGDCDGAQEMPGTGQRAVLASVRGRGALL